MKIADYLLDEDFEYRIDMFDSIKLDAGTFVKPIHYSYLPQHIKDRKPWTPFDPILEIYCYSSKGLFPIPLKIIRSV